MDYANESIYCTNCGVEITGLPVIKDGRPYCCLDCIHYLACHCAGIFELEEERLGDQRSILESPTAYGLI